MLSSNTIRFFTNNCVFSSQARFVVQDLLPEPTQKLPVDHAVVSHGFEVETNPRLGCETASFSRHRHMRLYFRLDNQEIACGPVTLDTVGTKLHTVRISDNPSKAKIAEKVWTKAEVVCDVTQRSTGGFDVSVHSNAKITNQTSITLEIGCYGPKQKVDPLVLIVDAGDSAWLPITTTSYGRMSAIRREILSLVNASFFS